MSLVPVPVCSACAQVAAVSISCSTCCRLCCGTCFGLTSSDFGGEARLLALLSVRVCVECRGPARRMEAVEKPTVTVKRERCWIHGKELKLFCLQCDECICGECFLDAGSHMRHQIDFIEAVYKEKRAETERKLAALDEKVRDLKQDVVQVEKNLEIVEGAERAVLEEIEMVCQEAKAGVAKMTEQRKRMLRVQADLPAKKQKLNDVLTEMVEKLPPEEFFKQQPQVEKQCDEISMCIPASNFQPVEFEDIGCDLVPAYDMQTCTLVNFDRVCFGWPKYFTSESDVLWNIFLHRKADDLFIKVFTANETAQKHPFKVLVLIPHKDLNRTIQKTFNICGESQEEVIASYAALFKDGFVTLQNELVVKVGVRPANAITENRFLRQQYQTLKARITDLEKKQNTIEKQMQSKFSMMHFSAFVSKTPKKTQEAQHSAPLIDRADRHWVLRVYPFESSLPDTNLKVFVVLRKGSRTKCRYFIELIHDNPQLSVLQTTESLFESIDAGYGWHCFVDRSKLLADAGFYPNGILRFRFGVQPIEK